MENLTEIGETLVECAPKMDIPGSLPIEIFHEILKYLSPCDLYSARDCCRKWRNMMKTFWKIKCKTECYFESEDDLNSKFYHEYMKQFSRWEGIYMYNSKLEDNWINCSYKEVVNDVDTFFSGFSIKYFSGDVIIGISSCNEIFVINSNTAMIEKRFKLTFLEGIVLRCIHAVGKSEKKLIVVIGTTTLNEYGCFNYPETLVIKTWNIETGESLQSLQMETIEVRIREVLIYNNLITTLSHPYAAYMYNITTENVDYIRHCVTNVCHDNDKIAMGIHSGTVVILDLDYTELMSLNCCDSERIVFEIQMKGNYLIILSGSNTEPGLKASIWNIESKTKLYQVEKVYPDSLAIHFNENKLLYKCGDFQKGKLRYKLCDLETGECILDLAPSYVTIRNSFILKGDFSNFRLLKLWSIKTGKLIADLQLPEPLSFECFENVTSNSKTKSKFVYLHYDENIKKWTLKIMDFEANINRLRVCYSSKPIFKISTLMKPMKQL